MKLKVIKNAYYVTEDLTNWGPVSGDEFENSYSHLLVVGDVWEKVDDKDDYDMFKCISGKWEGELSDGWWDYDDVKSYFEII